MRLRRNWNHIYKVLGKNLAIQNFNSGKTFFGNEDEIKTFSYEGKLRDFIVTRLSLKELLKGVLQREGK